MVVVIAIPSLIHTVHPVNLTFSSVLWALTGRRNSFAYWNITTHDDTGPTFRVASVEPGATGTPSGGHDRFNSYPACLGFWLFLGVLNQQPAALAATPAPAAEMPGITIISASQTGNARRVAEALRDDLLAAKLNVKLVNAGDHKFKQIASEKLLIVVTSTQGEGEPPEEAVALHKFLFSKKRQSWKTPRLPCLASAIALMNFLPVRERF